MAQTKDYRLGEFTFPRGWFMIAEASELMDGKPLPVRFFGKEFALYRGLTSGKVILLDAYCPHMGTNLAGPNHTSYVVQDNLGTNIEGDSIRCPYHAWRFGPDGKCDDIPYHEGEPPANACVKSWTVHESLGAVWVWHDPEGGEPQWDPPAFEGHEDPAWVNPAYDHLGILNQHPQEVVDNIVDYSHLDPVHGSTVTNFENEIIGHTAVQRQCGPHRTLVTPDGLSPILHTITWYEGPGVLFSDMTGMGESRILITHTPVDDGSIKVWHALWVKSMTGSEVATVADRVTAKQFQETAKLAFAQDFELWATKAPCINGMFLPSDGPFMKSRIWYRQFYNPKAKQKEYLDMCEGYYVPQGVEPYTPEKKSAA